MWSPVGNYGAIPPAYLSRLHLGRRFLFLCPMDKAVLFSVVVSVHCIFSVASLLCPIQIHVKISDFLNISKNINQYVMRRESVGPASINPIILHFTGVNVVNQC